MDATRNILLKLVRSALWGVPISDLPSDVDWNKVCLLAKQQTLLGLVADAVQKLPQDRKPEEKIIRHLQAWCMKNVQAHYLITSRLAKSVEILRSEGIEPVLFKGHGLALNYPDPLSRACGDIDLYVGRDRYESAVNVCVEKFGVDPDASESSKHYHFDYQGVTLELHRIAENLPGPAENRRYQDWTVESLEQSELRHVEVDGVKVCLPPAHFDAIYVMNHAWHHFVTGGVGLRQVCDWTMHIHKFHKELDVNRLDSDLKAFGLLRVWKYLACIAIEYLGLPEEECPLYSREYSDEAKRVLEVIWNEGNFGKHSEIRKVPRPKGYAAGKLYSFRNNTIRYFSIFSIYPSYMLKAWIVWALSGVYYYFKGLGK